MPTAWGILLPALTGGGSGSIVSDHFLTVTTLKYLPLIFFIFVGAVKEITLYGGGLPAPIPCKVRSARDLAPPLPTVDRHLGFDLAAPLM